MRTLVKAYFFKYSVACFFAFLMVGYLPGGKVFATAQSDSDQKKLRAEQLLTSTMPGNPDTYEYLMEDRADPFVPFLAEKVPELDPNEIIDPSQKLTGMQLFEPGQLTLVALMQTNGQFSAMVEDFNGKGYLIEEGIKIGRRGVVRAIIPNKVIIEENATTRSGKVLTNKIVMVLKKEGEE